MTRPAGTKAANGDGSVFARTQRGKKVWIAQVSLGYKSNGSRRVTTRSAPTQRAAQRLLREMLGERDGGRLAQVHHHTVHTYGLHWAREIKPLEIRASTAAGYEDIIRRYIIPALGRKRLSELRAPDVQGLLSSMRKEGYSTNTINQTRRILSGVCKHAVRHGLMAQNPVLATDPLRRQAGEKTQVREPWTLEETRRGLHALGGHDDLDCFAHIMLLTGLRPGEALGLRWEDIDASRHDLHVTGTLKEDRRFMPDGTGVTQRTRNDPKTKASRRTLAITPDLWKALDRQQMRQDLWRGLAAEEWVASGYVITTRKGTPYFASNFRKKFYKALESVGIRRVRLHDLRHVVARLALEGDARLEEVSQALGHTRVDTTKQIYAGFVRQLNDRFTATMASIIETHEDPSTLSEEERIGRP